MPVFNEDEEDKDLAGTTFLELHDGSSDNEMDETMRDADDADGDIEAEPDPESPSNSSQASETFTGDAQPSQPNPEVLLTSPSPPNSTAVVDSSPIIPRIRDEVLKAITYDIVPTVAAPQSTSINTLTATADMRWIFSGGSDGYIRRYNWVESVNGKLMLTVAQKHPFVDSVVKAGVMMSYWENWDAPARSDDSQVLSPVYSLAVQNQGLWLLSGVDSGAIRLQSVRHEEGKEVALLRKHTSAVSVLALSSDEKSLLSGSWDKHVHDWDLNTGQVRNSFASSAGQISAIAHRPLSDLPVPQDLGEPTERNVGLAMGSRINGLPSSESANGINGREQSRTVETQGPTNGGSPADSLFGGDDGDDDLFGDSNPVVTANGAPSGGAFGDEEEDEFSRAIADVPRSEEAIDGNADADGLPNGLLPVQPPETGISQPTDGVAGEQSQNVQINGSTMEPTINGILHDEAAGASQGNPPSGEISDTSGKGLQADSIFLAASIDGTIRVWDRRQPNPVARIVPRNTPPWCMNACWSPDGNFIYAGRRNGTVEEYSLHKGLRNPERVFKFPLGSGQVTALKAMPNGRHLLCASYDILRLYDLKEPPSARSTVPFLIVPGHRTGVVSQLYLDPEGRFIISTGGNRGWEGTSTEVLLGYEVGVPG